MPELLLELLSEEIPARMQARAAADLRALVTDALVGHGLTYEGAQAHATPRRLVLSVEGLAAAAPDHTEERKGPRVDAPEAAVNGFLKSAGVSLADCAVVEDRKGAFYVARIRKTGRPTPELVAEIVPDVVRRFPWPRSMRWGAGSLRWVRPLQSILATFDGDPVPFEIDGIRSGNVTRGHRFMAPGEIVARRFDDYAAALARARVVLDAGERADTIRAEARTLAFARGLDLIEDEALIAETAGLVEWPVVLMGEFGERFLDVPPEVIVTSIKAHQKCFALTDRTGKLANRYLLVANLIASDGGRKIVAGNNRVIAARLADARFFWDQDRKVRLEDRLGELDQITFHARLGSQRQRVERIAALAAEIAALIGADPDQARLAARLAKADLVTGMVGEFPELQGLMGYYYARAEGHDPAVCEAIRDHYKPQGPSDAVPAGKLAQAVALADKLDTLTGFWAIDEKPTGSKDPYALRRAALGVIRIVLEGSLRLGLVGVLEQADSRLEVGTRIVPAKPWRDRDAAEPILDLLAFFADRLKVHLRDQGLRHDLIDAVFSLGGQDDLALIVRRVEALAAFLGSDDGVNLLAGVKRATNIVRIEEKKDGRAFDGAPDPKLLVQGEEKELYRAVAAAEANARKAVAEENFVAAMAAIAKLRKPVDDFFDDVTVNADDPSFRDNRLKLLNRIRQATLAVADFSRIEG